MINLVNKVSAVGGANSATTSGETINTAGATLIIVAVSSYGSDPVLTDNVGNTYIKLQTSTTTNSRSAMYYCAGPVTNANHYFTVTGTGTYPSIAVLAYSGTDNVMPLTRETGNSTGAPSTTLVAGSITPPINNCLVVTSLATDAANTASINSSFVIEEQRVYTAAVNMGIALAAKVQTTAAVEGPTWTLTGSTNLAAKLVVFVPDTVKQSVYTIDAHNGITDPANVWTNDANAFDSDEDTHASVAVSGTASSNYLQGAGSNSPSSGTTITALRFRFKGQSTSSSLGVDIYPPSLFGSLVSGSITSATLQWTEWFAAVSNPTLWTDIQGATARIFAESPSSAGQIAKIEIEVTHIDDGPPPVSSLNSFFFMFR